MVLRGLVLEIWPLKGGPSFRDAFLRSTPRKFQIAAIRKRNGFTVSNFQDFLVSMISTSVLNKKKIYFVWCTPLFELGWNDPMIRYLNIMNFMHKNKYFNVICRVAVPFD